jgi:hypothetical protein
MRHHKAHSFPDVAFTSRTSWKDMQGINQSLELDFSESMWLAGEVPIKNDLAGITSEAKDMNIVVAYHGLISAPIMVPECCMLSIIRAWGAARIKEIGWTIFMVLSHLSINYNKHLH